VVNIADGTAELAQGVADGFPKPAALRNSFITRLQLGHEFVEDRLGFTLPAFNEFRACD